MNQENVAIMKELKERLQRKFGFISKVILFGSQATGQAVEFSDYDILIIASRPISWRQRRKIVDEVYVSDLKYNILTDVKVISELELKSLKGKQPFVQHALQEGGGGMKDDEKNALIEHRVARATDTIEEVSFLIKNKKFLLAVNRIYNAYPVEPQNNL